MLAVDAVGVVVAVAVWFAAIRSARVRIVFVYVADLYERSHAMLMLSFASSCLSSLCLLAVAVAAYPSL